MKILIYSDPHLGLKRTANTTLKSSLALRDALLSQALKVCTDFSSHYECQASFCAGDLFDSFSNSEEVIRSAAEVVNKTTLILAGNHDMENRADSVGSLQLLRDIHPSPEKFLVNDMNDSEPYGTTLEGTEFLFVPHTPTQEKYEHALLQAAQAAREGADNGTWKVLITHCNLMAGYPDASDSTLNLSKELVEQLLQDFHKILLGHEHVPNSFYEGRVQVIGNLHPTGFSDISDKRVLIYDTQTGAIEFVPVWRKDEWYYSGPASNANDRSCSFYDLQDDLLPGEANKLVSRLFTKGAMAVRISGQESLSAARLEQAQESLESLPEKISRDLKENRPDLYPLWEELKNED